MDGFETNSTVLWMASTNRPDILDPALTRPDRLSFKVSVPLPDLSGRLEILRVHTRNKALAHNVDLDLLARKTTGCSGAALKEICNQAAILSAMRSIKLKKEAASARQGGQITIDTESGITMAQFDEAIVRVEMGAALNSRAQAMSEAEKRNTAFHEAGHAAVAKLKGGDPVSRITIIPRDSSLGATTIIPPEDRFSYTQQQLLTEIMVLMGGRIAQEVFLQITDTGAANDYDRACELARRMVVRYGMSKLGAVNAASSESSMRTAPVGSKLSDEIDDAWIRIVRQCNEQAKEAILSAEQNIRRVVDGLLEKETILGEEFERLWTGE
jgi:cell division protease FtsH